MAVRIKDVEPASPAQAAGLRAGMRLISLDGHPIHDGLDYEFYSPPAQLLALVQDEEGGPPREVHVHKEEYQPLGCVFESYLIDGQHACKNRCVFCFIDQLPKGLRPSLYFKDDDERLGFLFGNYVTLTNLSDTEIDRIIEQRIAPVNISVHTASPALRVQMMGNSRAGEVLAYIPKLAAAGIPLNCQLVLCPGLNDGEELRHTIEWLAGYRPAVQSIAAVPVGLTRHREGLYPLEGYTRKTAAAQLDILLEMGDAYLKQGGSRLVFPADEWFLLAGRPLPPDAFYEGYPQLENGVGMWRLFHDEFLAALDDATAPTAHLPAPCAADIAVGTLAAPLLEELAAALHARFPQVRLYVHAIENHFFGPDITVTGLLTGADIIAQLQGRLHTSILLLPPLLLRNEGDLLLDGQTPAGIAETLGVDVRVPNEGGAGLVDALLHARLP